MKICGEYLHIDYSGWLRLPRLERMLWTMYEILNNEKAAHEHQKSKKKSEEERRKAAQKARMASGRRYRR